MSASLRSTEIRASPSRLEDAGAAPAAPKPATDDANGTGVRAYKLYRNGVFARERAQQPVSGRRDPDA